MPTLSLRERLKAALLQTGYGIEAPWWHPRYGHQARHRYAARYYVLAYVGKDGVPRTDKWWFLGQQGALRVGRSVTESRSYTGGAFYQALLAGNISPRIKAE